MITMCRGWFAALLVLMFSVVPAAYGQEVSVTSEFGWRMHPIYGYNKFHTGVDLGYSYGSPVGALDEGVVQLAGWYGGYGNCVIIRHNNGDSTLYGHLARVETEVGEHVPAGRLIGFSGSTGVSTGPHLHLEWWHDGQYCDPLVLLGYGGSVSQAYVESGSGVTVASASAVHAKPKEDFGLISFLAPKKTDDERAREQERKETSVVKRKAQMPLSYTESQMQQIEDAKYYQGQGFQRRDTISYDGTRGVGFNI